MDGTNLPILKLTPYADEKVWGGSYLRNLKGLAGKAPVGETLEISTLKNMNSLAQGRILIEIVGELSFILKLIETTDNLSIQVHPNDEYAKKVESSKGKSECWLILDSKPGAGIYLGLKKGVDRDLFLKTVKENGPVHQLLNYYEVSRGDFFFVPAGTIHAIGEGLLLAEVQQNCGVTYRVWDWNRVGLDGKPRELHLDKALDVIEFDPLKNNLDYFSHQKSCLNKSGKEMLSQHPDFHFEILNHQNEIPLKRKRSNGIINLGADEVELEREGQRITLKSLESALISETSGEATKIHAEKSHIGHIF